MTEHSLTTVAKNFYSELNVKCNFKTRVNAQDLQQTVNEIIDQLSEETMKRYYGSGFIIPDNLEGARILDMGSGSGSLVFILSKLVGPKGYIVGVDICKGLVETAQNESEYHYKKWGYDKPNFEFRCANIEKISELGFPEGSFDAVVSNGVFCLCPDKKKVFEQAYKMLKPGGQFLLSDVYAQVRQPDSLLSDEKLWALGTTGSMVWSDLDPLVRSVGFTTPHLLQAAPVDIKDDEVKKVLKNAIYVCAAWRLFKLPPNAERGAASVTYKGNILDRPDSLSWDKDLIFKTGEAVNVDSQLAAILANTSYSQNFDVKDFAGSVQNKRNQNPFEWLKELENQKQAPEPIYAVE